MTYVSHKNWQTFLAMIELTFRSMTMSLLKPEATDAVNLLQAPFVGFLGPVDIDDIDEPLADFLTSEGVLVRPDVNFEKNHVASPLVNGLVRRTHSLGLRSLIQTSVRAALIPRESLRYGAHKSSDELACPTVTGQ
jgi:hypothetical protein